MQPPCHPVYTVDSPAPLASQWAAVRRLAGRCAILAGGVLGIWWVFVRILGPYSLTANEDFCRALRPKQAALAALGRPPGVVLVGGSNLALSVDSRLLRSLLPGHPPVYNHGLHAGFGLAFMLNEVEPLLIPGDHLVLIPEYFITNGTLGIQAELLDVVPEFGHYLEITPQDRLRLIPIRAQRTAEGIFRRLVFQSQSKVVYREDGFNEDGDLTSHLGMPRPFAGELGDDQMLYADYHPWAERLATFSERLRSRGVAVSLTYPCLPDYKYLKFAPHIQVLDKLYRQQPAIHLLGHPKDQTYPDQYFFDTIYHMNRPGRQARTKTLARLMAGALETRSE